MEPDGGGAAVGQQERVAEQQRVFGPDPRHGGEDRQAAGRVGDEPGGQRGGREGLGDEIGDAADVAPSGADDGQGCAHERTPVFQA
ncbi:hypothetical protein M8C11_08000 [Micromonospora sp. CPM1]|uniref:hypothetical protein n=1 Tax=Micromonospora sp. CPM1 TaxID=2944809 RepID=UPI00207CAF8A|nr:hypothetical protein [Micromonospora sp. CPM1]MCO1614656.1 hypothetical protein [Micromonospora sp. CPM1]